LLQAREQRGDQTNQADEHRQRCHGYQIMLHDGDGPPQFVERHARQHRHQRLSRKFVDVALQAKDLRTVLQADERGGDRRGLQIEFAHVLGWNAQARHESTRRPVNGRVAGNLLKALPTKVMSRAPMRKTAYSTS
jgi:hypothetical protein